MDKVIKFKELIPEAKDLLDYVLAMDNTIPPDGRGMELLRQFLEGNEQSERKENLTEHSELILESSSLLVDSAIGLLKMQRPYQMRFLAHEIYQFENENADRIRNISAVLSDSKLFLESAKTSAMGQNPIVGYKFLTNSNFEKLSVIIISSDNSPEVRNAKSIATKFYENLKDTMKKYETVQDGLFPDRISRNKIEVIVVDINNSSIQHSIGINNKFSYTTKKINLTLTIEKWMNLRKKLISPVNNNTEAWKNSSLNIWIYETIYTHVGLYDQTESSSSKMAKTKGEQLYGEILNQNDTNSIVKFAKKIQKIATHELN